MVIDLSLLATEILENVTALIGRLLLETLQRLTSKEATGAARGEFPVVLVLEEAQNYIRETRGVEEESVARLVFERIARRQKTWIGARRRLPAPERVKQDRFVPMQQLHRPQAPEPRGFRYFRDVVPSAYAPLLEQLPSLAPRHALFLGDAVSVPVLTYMREANPPPRSADPRFWKHWTDETPQVPNSEKIANEWAGNDTGDHPERISEDSC